MTIQTLHFDDTLPHGRKLRACLVQLQAGRDDLFYLLKTMTLMVDGDGSAIGHFDEVMTRFGFPSTTVAKAAWDELNSFVAKLNGNGIVDNVLAATDQVFNKFR